MIRGNILLGGFVVVAVLAAVIGLAQLWFEVFSESYLVKSFLTLGIAGVVISFLVALDYDLPASHRKYVLYALAALIVSGAGISVYQIWTSAIATATFAKIIISVAVLAGLLSFVVAAVEDLGGNKKLRDEKFID